MTFGKMPIPSEGSFLRALISKWTNQSLRVKGLAILSIPFLAMLVSGTLLVRLEREKIEAEQFRQRALDMRAQLQNMYIVLISAESEVRNYGLNGQEDGLYPFGVTTAAIDPLFARVKELMQDSAAQKEQLEPVQALVHARILGLKALREYYQSKPLPGAISAELRANAKISPDVLVAVNKMATAASKQIQERIKNDISGQVRLWIEIIAITVLGWIGGLLATLLASRSVGQRIRTLETHASRIAEGLPSDALDPGSDELGRLGSAIDKAGRAIAARSDELRLALAGGEVLIWEMDPDGGRIGYHAGSDQMHGAFQPEHLPQGVDAWLAIVHQEDREQVELELNRITSESGTFQIEYRVVGRGGNIRWMRVRAQSHILQTGERRLLGILADITARKTASNEIERQAGELRASREALQSQTRILQSILDSMGDGVVVADLDGKFIVFNPAARQILNVRSFGSGAELWAIQNGLFLPDAVTHYPPDQLPFARAIRGEFVDCAEMFVRPADATEDKWVSVTARPLREEGGEIRGGVLVIRDITSAKHQSVALELSRKEAETANHAKSEFLSRMSHELRTPLNSILGFAQLLELGMLTEQARDNVYHILKGGYHLLDLINEILDLARIESGRLAISLEPVRMREALKDALDLVRPLAADKSVSISPDIALRCNRHVRADHQRLKQVFLNLLSNAIKFNRSGGSVVVSYEETNDNRLRIEVIDTGAGIAPESVKKLFLPFERLNADRTEAQGTGLGLALSKRLMEAMGGTIGVESSVGFGSRFSIELAMVEDPSVMLNLEENKVALVEESGSTYHPRTVLYIEDNSSNLKLVEGIFARHPGARLLSAMHGYLGLDLADLHKPDWILLDLHLPDISGEEVLRRLRANPGTAHIPVTILSADATNGQVKRLIQAGARDYLTKPLDIRKFIRLLEQMISENASRAVETRVYAERNYPE